MNVCAQYKYLKIRIQPHTQQVHLGQNHNAGSIEWAMKTSEGQWIMMVYYNDIHSSFPSTQVELISALLNAAGYSLMHDMDILNTKLINIIPMCSTDQWRLVKLCQHHPIWIILWIWYKLIENTFENYPLFEKYLKFRNSTYKYYKSYNSI